MRTLLVLFAGVSVIVISAAPAPAATEPQLRANGRIAFATGEGVASVNPDGSGLWALRFSPGSARAPASWSPDGTKLLSTGLNPSGRVLSVSDPDGTNLRQLSIPAYANNPDWSPDGTRIAYDNYEDIFVADPDGTNARKLTDGVMPSWSPDGTKLVYAARQDARGFFDLYSYDLETKQRTRLTSWERLDFEPDWSPAGDKIVFVSDRAAGQSLYTMNADGSDQRQLTRGDNDSDPVWSPDGSTIAYAQDSQIWTIRADGSNATPLTFGTGYAGSPAWQPLSPAPSGDSCTLRGTRGNDLLVGTAGNDVICGFEGNDSLVGLDGHDILRGNQGNDWIAGGAGYDQLRGGDGNDLLDSRDGGPDVLSGDLDSDTARTDRRRIDSSSRSTEQVTVSWNVAVWRPVEASDELSSNPAVLAVDGRADSFWATGNLAPGWIQIDLGKPTRIARIRLITPELPAVVPVLVLGRRANSGAAHLLHRFNGPTIFKEVLSFRPKKPWPAYRYLVVQIPAIDRFTGMVTFPEVEAYTAVR
jgi:dipeptidyl aminopeptidase/acylaminoacyl peptidase